ALVFGGEEPISAPRTDQDRRPGRLLLRREIDGDRRDVARVVLVAGVGADRPGRALGPERICPRFLGRGPARGKQREADEEDERSEHGGGFRRGGGPTFSSLS